MPRASPESVVFYARRAPRPLPRRRPQRPGRLLGLLARVLGLLMRERFCGETGVANGAWYTLIADPPGFHICRACDLAAAEPLGHARYFKNSNDGDPASLLRFATHRRMVFVQTVLPIRPMLLRARLGLQRQQQFLNVGSSHYNNSGKTQETTMPSAYESWQSGLGTFANRDLPQGAQHDAPGGGHLGESGQREPDADCRAAGEAVEGYRPVTVPVSAS
ncbi:hypothetical protein DL767_000125 [Monosporascus sp. MG133]|nr:hypothetical protein DL767_000125 [Monosporascus sp. MG133]